MLGERIGHDGISALICDLDHTLFSSNTIPREVVQPAIDAIHAADALSGGVDADDLTWAIEEGWRRPFDLVVRDRGLPDWILEAWVREHARLEVVGPLAPYDDVDNLWGLPAVTQRIDPMSGEVRGERGDLALRAREGAGRARLPTNGLELAVAGDGSRHRH